MDQPLLEKWECVSEDCAGSFLVNEEKSKGRKLCCPFCGHEAEATVGQNPDPDERNVVYGCLYPW